MLSEKKLCFQWSDLPFTFPESVIETKSFAARFISAILRKTLELTVLRLKILRCKETECGFFFPLKAIHCLKEKEVRARGITFVYDSLIFQFFLHHLVYNNMFCLHGLRKI